LQIYYLISLRAGLFSAQNFPFQEVNFMKCHQERRVCAHWTDNWRQEESFTQAQEDPSGGLCYYWHTTAQHSIDENYNVFSGIYGWKVNWKTVTHMSKKMTIERKKIAFISCQINTEERNDICLRLPWLAVEALIMKKRVWNSTGIRTGEIRSLFSSSFKGERSLTSWQTMRMDHDNLRKKSAMASFLTTKPRQEGSSTIRKQQSRWMA
jgi:hypothetical protein